LNKCIAIITARGGSKRIPRKNIKTFLGSPIIKYSIGAAIKSKCFNEIMVSTDDKEMAEVSEKFGAKIPFLRSQATSSDFATTSDVIKEVLLKYKNIGKNFKYCCCIYPTAPFVSAERLREGFDILKSKKVDSVFPVVRFGYPIQRALKIKNGHLSMICPKNLNARSQDLMPAYHDAGQFYWFRVEKFLKHKKIFTENMAPLVIPEAEAQDIDTEEDWMIAEMKYSLLKHKQCNCVRKDF